MNLPVINLPHEFTLNHLNSLLEVCLSRLFNSDAVCHMVIIILTNRFPDYYLQVTKNCVLNSQR